MRADIEKVILTLQVGTREAFRLLCELLEVHVICKRLVPEQDFEDFYGGEFAMSVSVSSADKTRNGDWTGDNAKGRRGVTRLTERTFAFLLSWQIHEETARQTTKHRVV